MQAEEKGLEAQKVDSFNEITQGANRRGLLFSGIPLQEQAQYTGSSFLPAVANLKAKYAQQKFNLQDALAKINQDQTKTAYDIYGNELAMDEAAKARADAARAAASVASPSFGGFGGGGGNESPTPRYQLSQRADKGFNFVGPNGQAISAAQYSQAMRIPYRQLLQQMANAGDRGAASALGLVGDDYGFNRSKVSSQSQLNLLRALGINTGGFTPTGFGGQSNATGF